VTKETRHPACGFNLPPGDGLVRLLDWRAGSGRVEVNQAAPIERIPLNLRAGSILPLGRPSNTPGRPPIPSELRIYPGAMETSISIEDEETAIDTSGSALHHPLALGPMPHGC